jgi:hypothetical protein
LLGGVGMAQTYRKAKVESLYQAIELIQKHSSEKADEEQDESLKRYLKGQADAFEYVLQMLEREFTLTAE